MNKADSSNETTSEKQQPVVQSEQTSGGEMLSPTWHIKWVNPQRIEAGEALVPAKLQSDKAREYAATNLILADLNFAHGCLKQAYELGVPNIDNLQSTALIYSGVIGYARCYKTGVREVKLDPSAWEKEGEKQDLAIHDYLIALRDKHVAHSVNDFEECLSTAVVLGYLGEKNVGWRDGGGVGVVMKRSVGITRELLLRATDHIQRVIVSVTSQLDKLRLEVYAEFKAAFDKDKKWEMAPIVQFSDRKDIAKARTQKTLSPKA